MLFKKYFQLIRIFHFNQEGIIFSEFNAKFNSFPMKAVLSSKATGFAMSERSPNAAGTLLRKQLLRVELAAAEEAPDSE